MIGLRGIPVSQISGGVEKAVEEISTRLARRGHQVTVFCRSKYRTSNQFTFKGVQLKNLPSIYSKHLEAISHTGLCTLATLFSDFDIIHFHALGPSLLSFLPRLFLKKTVVTVHGLDWKRAKWGLLATHVLKMGEFSSIYFPNRTIVVSKTLQKYYKEKYKKDVIYIPNGIDIPNYHPDRKFNKFGLENNGYLLFLSRIVPEKGCHHLINAFKKIGTDKKLVIVGPSTYSADYLISLKRLAENDERIIFLGSLYGSDKNEIFNNAYLYILPSEIEGLPITLLEAMSWGKAALVSDIPENLEVICPDGALEKFGFYFKNKDINDLKEKINYILNNPSVAAEVGNRAKQFVIKNYNWDIITKKTEQVYLDLSKN